VTTLQRHVPFTSGTTFCVRNHTPQIAAMNLFVGLASSTITPKIHASSGATFVGIPAGLDRTRVSLLITRPSPLAAKLEIRLA
jgi:hypothetical protein